MPRRSRPTATLSRTRLWTTTRSPHSRFLPGSTRGRTLGPKNATRSSCAAPSKFRPGTGRLTQRWPGSPPSSRSTAPSSRVSSECASGSAVRRAGTPRRHKGEAGTGQSCSPGREGRTLWCCKLHSSRGFQNWRSGTSPRASCGLTPGGWRPVSTPTTNMRLRPSFSWPLPRSDGPLEAAAAWVRGVGGRPEEGGLLAVPRRVPPGRDCPRCGCWSGLHACATDSLMGPGALRNWGGRFRAGARLPWLGLGE
mmetsp:Transcript_1456/g.3691  ORF Transcript_1456/g.3691 Transcript_1456/m.3691 type:complete len:252 (-) Transcript_1456:233-988(-)